MNVTTQNAILSIIIIALTASDVFFVGQYFVNRKKTEEINQYIVSREQGREVLQFLKLFTARVIKAEGQVSFDDRLILEDAVRNLRDQELWDQWQKFLNSQTSDEAQTNLRDLLDALLTRIEL